MQVQASVQKSVCCYSLWPLLVVTRIIPSFWEILCPARMSISKSLFLSHGFCGLNCVTAISRPASASLRDEVSNSFNTLLKNFSSILSLKESQSSLDMKNKLGTTKQTENGQLESQSKVPAEDLTLTFR